MTKGKAVPTTSPQVGRPHNDPMRILFEAIRQGALAPTALEQRQVIIQLLSQHGIRIHSQDPIFELADVYGRHYRKLAMETITNAREEFGKKNKATSLWMVAICSGGVAWALGLMTGPFLLMRQVDPRYATVGLVSILFCGLVAGVIFWLLPRISRVEENNASR